MRKKLFVAAALIFAAAFLVACGDTINIGGPSQVTVINPGGSGGAPSPSPSGDPGTASFAYVRVGFYGFSPDSNPVCAELRNSEGLLKFGCQGAATATPKNADGTDASEAQHGPNCQWEFEAGFPPDVVSVSVQSNPFNVDVRPVKAGSTRLCARVKDRRGCFDIRVE